MHTPTKQQWQTVIDNFEKVLSMAKQPNHFDMHETEVNGYGHKCGTIHCIAGWYAIATCDLTKQLDFHPGANSMAKDLGFEDSSALEEWARERYEVWGNGYGRFMFSGSIAYGNAETLQEAVEYLKGVRDRSPE